ncbi:MAG: conjugal transfer protein TraN [Deferribacterales bacterium]
MSGNVCYSAPVCSSGVYDATLDTCILYAAALCSAGYTFNASTDKCELAPSCSAGSYSSTIDKCAQLPTITCATDYTYNSSLKLCENNPTCSSGSYNSAQNQCLTGYACPYNGQPCIETGGQWKCSKYPCYNATDESNYTNDDTTEGANDILADGETDDEGNCLGSIYIFNGNDNRCRKPGAQTGFSDCCKKKKDWLGLAKCNPKEQMLSSLRSWGKLDGQCHEVGEYCSEKWVGVCVQKKKTYCCFGSALARIIIEQGRPQLDIGWGSAKAPNCRGFTPEEFQKLDFSKISFDEWIEEYVVPELNENITNNIKETFENITLPTGVSQ